MRTADRSGTRWLLAELPELVTNGDLSTEAAEALRQHYAATDSGAPRRIGFALSAILGSLLIGAQSFWRCSFAAFWAAVYLVGAVSFKDWRATRPHPFVAAGWIGVLSLAIFLSFQDTWRTQRWQNAVDLIPRHYPDVLATGIQIASVLAALLFAAYALWKERQINLAPAVFAPIALVAWGIAKQTGDPLIPSLLLNFFILGLGIFTLLRGVRTGRVFEANLGMLVVAILAIARFFDNEFEFFVRGIAFIAIGLGFLGTNLVVFKRRARA